MQKRPLAWPPPPESAASLGASLADQSHVHGPGPGLPGQRKLLPNPRARLLGYGPPPTWGCTEDTAVSSTLNTPLWPSTQRMPGSATCGRDTPGGHWPALPPHGSGPQPQPLRHWPDYGPAWGNSWAPCPLAPQPSPEMGADCGER